MQGFPMDSHVTWTVDPDTGATMPEFDRAVTSEPLREYIKGVITNGVLPNPSNNLQVSAGTDGMTVLVNAGFCVIEGGLAIEPNTRTLEVTSADSTYDRIDTVVARWDSNDANRRVDLHIVQGVPASTPVRPTLTRNESIYELGLADVFVTKGVATITNEKITDTRMESARCGICSSISEWDTTTIYQQVQADLKQFKSSEQTAFMDWFDRMKDQLTEDAAGELQAEIDSINENVSALHAGLESTDANLADVQSQIVTSGNIENGNTATSAHTVGTYIQWKGKFYTVTAAIAVGDTLADGTNLTEKTVGEVLTQINSDLSDKQSKTDNSLATTSKTIVGAINELDSDMSNVSETFFQNSLDSYQWIKAHYNPKTKLVVVDVCRFVAVANGTTIGILSAHRPANQQIAYCIMRNSDGTTQFGNFTIDSTGAIKIHALTTNTDIAGCAHFEFPASS